MALTYTPNAWYWIVAGNTTQVFSSTAGAAVTTSNAAYQAWLAAGNLPSRIGSWTELFDVLSAQAPGAWALALATLVAGGGLRPDQMTAALFAGGLKIASTANPTTYNATYPTDPTSQGKITAIAAGIAAGKGLPGGGSTVGVLDAAGATHAFTSADYLNLAAALEEFVYQVLTTEAVLLAGSSAAWPAATATIP